MRRSNKQKVRLVLWLLPFLAYMLFILTVGLADGLIQSFGYIPSLGLTSFTLDYYKKVFAGGAFMSSLGFTLWYSLVSTALSVSLGVLLAVLIRNYEIRYLKTIFQIPLMVPHITAALFTMLTLASTGILPRLLYQLGLIASPADFPGFHGDVGGWGIILTYVWKGLPFVFLTTITVLEKLSDRLTKAALNLGANRWQIFWRITLPLIRPGIATTFMILFAFSFGAYELPLLLGPTVPKALAVLTYTEYINPLLQNRPLAMAYNFLIIGICMGLSVIFLHLIVPKDKRGRRQ
jgi:putative spermidine/putrescine transport system permease protein